ncbi:hypothetical protein CRYUN_Cryun20dG0030300 [Craigia yunnanensis]
MDRMFRIFSGSRMQRSLTSLVRPLTGSRGFSTSSEKITASILFERLPVVISEIDPVVYAFQEFSFRWRQHYRRRYPDEFLDMSKSRHVLNLISVVLRIIVGVLPSANLHVPKKCKVQHRWFLFSANEVKILYNQGKRSLQRALDRRLYLLLYGNTHGAPSGKPVWHFPEKVYDSEETLRKCAESALESVIGDLSHTYFVGNAPMGHMVKQQTENVPEPYKLFFFKSQVIDTNKFNIVKCEDFVWVTKDELLEYFPEQAEFLKKMIIS